MTAGHPPQTMSRQSEEEEQQCELDRRQDTAQHQRVDRWRQPSVERTMTGRGERLHVPGDVVVYEEFWIRVRVVAEDVLACVVVESHRICRQAGLLDHSGQERNAEDRKEKGGQPGRCLDGASFWIRSGHEGSISHSRAGGERAALPTFLRCQGRRKS